MKSFITPLIVSAMMISSSTVYAESYAKDQLMIMVDKQDENCDEQVTFNEFFQERVTKNTDPYDRNQDGYITENEVALEMKEDLIETVNELHKHGVSEENINQTVISELEAIEKESSQIIASMDTDGDHLVEPEEITAYQKKDFKQLDTNRDGVISLKDLKPKKATAKGGFGFLYNKDK